MYTYTHTLNKSYGAFRFSPLLRQVLYNFSRCIKYGSLWLSSIDKLFFPPISDRIILSFYGEWIVKADFLNMLRFEKTEWMKKESA